MIKTAYNHGVARALADLGVDTSKTAGFGDVATPTLGAIPGSAIPTALVSGLTAPRGQRAETGFTSGAGQFLGQLGGTAAGGIAGGLGGAGIGALIQALRGKDVGEGALAGGSMGGSLGALLGAMGGGSAGAHYGRQAGLGQ